MQNTTTGISAESLVSVMQEHQQIEAASAAADHALQDRGLLYLPSDFAQHDVEGFMVSRIRARGTMQTPFVSDFAGYTINHADAGTTVFVDAQEMAATAVLNLGYPTHPGHADNKAKLAPIKTAAYRALLGVVDKPLTQQKAAEFFEDWAGQLLYFSDGENPAAISAKQAVAAVRRITIENLARVDSEAQSLSANRSAFESVSASSKDPIPTFVYFECRPYADLAQRTFVLRLGILTGEKTPSLVLRIQKAEEHTEEMANELAGLIREAFTGAEIPVLLGTYAKGA